MKTLMLLIAMCAAPFVVSSAAWAGVNQGAAEVRTGVNGSAAIERAQYVYGGQTYCWYDAGWKGPGWYYCGYAWRTGLGWGGGYGWRGWAWRGSSIYWRGGRYYRGGWRGGGGARPVHPIARPGVGPRPVQPIARPGVPRASHMHAGGAARVGGGARGGGGGQRRR